MTIFKPTTSKAPPSPKQMPKRGSKTLTLRSPVTDDTEETIKVDIPSDASLQSPTRRRRYMRRGSRAPSMFLQLSIPSLESLFEAEDDTRTLLDDAEQHQQRFQRRLSIMSLLGQQLEMKAVVDSPHNSQPKEASSTSLRPLKLQRKTSVPTNE